jgi:hypothetical protein
MGRRAGLLRSNMIQQIHHYTLNTGDGRLTDRSEVAPEVIDYLRPILDAGGGDVGGGLAVHVHGGENGGWLYEIRHGGDAVVACGLAVTDHHASGIWPILDDLAQHAKLPHPPRPPRTPWLSVLILYGAAGCDHETLMAVADLERCIAWTLIGE